MSTERSDDATRRGEGALLRGEWDEARAAFEESLAREASAAALDGLARALWWLADSQGAISAWERAYTALRGVGDRDRSARVALLLAEEYGEGRGNEAAANGWLARARDLLGDERSSTVGWLGVAAARSTSDPAAARELAAEALDIGRRLADPDLELVALGRLALAELALGQIEDGMTHFDQAMAAATAGEPRDLRTLGDLYCSLLLGAEVTLDMPRFMLWTDVVMAFMQRYRHPAVPGSRCRSGPPARTWLWRGIWRNGTRSELWKRDGKPWRRSSGLGLSGTLTPPPVSSGSSVLEGARARSSYRS